MNCKEFKDNVSRLARGELAKGEREACAGHAGECGECARLLEELRQAEATVRRQAAGDTARAGAALEGFEERVLERRRREQRAAALAGTRGRRPVRSGALRWALGLSLAANIAVLMVFGLGYAGWPKPGGGWNGGPGQGRGGKAETVSFLPAGLPQAEQMRHVYGELEELFGNRLSWVAQSGGDVSMGVISDPDEARAAEAGQAGPLVALVYWMDTADHGGKGGVGGGGGPVVILTRSGRGEIRQQAPLGPGRSPVEIAVDSFKAGRGGFAIQTQVRPVATGGARGGRPADSVSALEAAVSVTPGRPTKLGEVRVGDRMLDAWVAVQELGGADGAGKKAS